MPVKTTSLTLEGGSYRFVARGDSGHSVVLDGMAVTGMRPTELVSAAVAGCTAMDVVSILRKQRQEFTRYEIRATGEQREERPRVFTSFDVVHVLEGPALDVGAVRRAIHLAATKYCGVGASLAMGDAEIRHSFVIRDPAGHETADEVVVTGPHERPEALGSRHQRVAAAAG
jgi:putative redox protein